MQSSGAHGWAVMYIGSSPLLIKPLLFGHGCGVVVISCGWCGQSEHEWGGVVYDAAVSHTVGGGGGTDGQVYVAGGAKNRPSVCCPTGVVCFIVPAFSLLLVMIR